MTKTVGLQFEKHGEVYRSIVWCIEEVKEQDVPVLSVIDISEDKDLTVLEDWVLYWEPTVVVLDNGKVIAPDALDVISAARVAAGL